MYEEFGKVLNWMKDIGYEWDTLPNQHRVAQRKEGTLKLTMRDHLEALMLSILSANRPWIGIQRHEEDLRKVFHNYDPEYLKTVDPYQLKEEVCAIDCGNRRILSQMQEISYNIGILSFVEKKFGSVDYLADVAINNNQLEVVRVLSSSQSAIKLKGVGKALAHEYLKNVGVDTVKPDVHITRILHRMGWSAWEPDEDECFYIVQKIAKEYNLLMMQVGTILWQFCATGYLEICSATPSCGICPAKESCKYNRL